MVNWRILIIASIAAVAATLLFAGVALADNCSSPADCQETANYNTVVAVTGGGVAVVAGLIAVMVSSSTRTLLPPPLIGIDPAGLRPDEGSGGVAVEPPQGPASGPTPGDLGLPDTDPWGNPIDLRADGRVFWSDGYGDAGDGWVTAEQARELLGEANQAVADRDAQRDRSIQAGQDMMRDSTQAMVARNQEQARVEREALDTLANARADIETIRRIAEAHDWEDILQRVDDKAYNEDGSINVDYMRRLEGLTRNRIGLDVASPDPDGTEPHWITEGVVETIWDAKDSMIIRMGTGIMTLGSSEVIFQGMQAYEDVEKAYNEAADRGEDFGWTDAARTAGGTFIRENLPVNTITAMMDPKATWTDVAIGGAMDIFVMLDVAETAMNVRGSLNGIRAGDLSLGNMHHRSPDSIFAAIRRGPDLETSGPLWRTPLTDTPGYSHGPPPGGVDIEVPKEWGMHKSNVARAQDVADLHQVDVEIRPTKPESVERWKEGAVPKPKELKPKTVTKTDLYLNKDLTDGDLAKAAYFDPKLTKPAHISEANWAKMSEAEQFAKGKPQGMDPEDWAKVQKRFDQRRMEFAARKDEMAALSDRFQVEPNGTISKLYPDGPPRPVAGDHDIYAIYDRTKLDANGNPTLIPEEIEVPHMELVKTPDGKNVLYRDVTLDDGTVARVPEMRRVLDADGNPMTTMAPNPRYHAVVDSLKMPPFDAQHGAHLVWDPDSVKDIAIRDNVIIGHKPPEFSVEVPEPPKIEQLDASGNVVEVDNPRFGQTKILTGGGEKNVRFSPGQVPVEVYDQGTELMQEVIGSR